MRSSTHAEQHQHISLSYTQKHVHTHGHTLSHAQPDSVAARPLQRENAFVRRLPFPQALPEDQDATGSGSTPRSCTLFLLEGVGLQKIRNQFFCFNAAFS